MRRTFIVLGAALASLLAISLPAAALNITVAEPAGPIPFDAPTTLDVTIIASCQEILNDNPSDQPMQIDVQVSEPPLWMEGAGGKADWMRANCDMNTAPEKLTCNPQPDCGNAYPIAKTTATITITPKNIAPSLEPVSLTISVPNRQGTASVTVQVAHFGEMTATTDKTAVPAALADKQTFNALLDVNTNAVSLATFTVTSPPKFGKLVAPTEPVLVEPHVSLYQEHHAGFFVWTDGGPEAGKPLSMSVPFTFESPATVWTEDSVTLEVTMAAQKDPTLVTAPQTLTVKFTPTVTEDPNESPAPSVGLFVILAAVVVAFRRRNGA